MGRGRAGLLCDPVDEASDAGLRAQRLAGGARRLDPEKWRAWSDFQGDLEAHFSRDFLLTLLTLYWVTETITPSMRDYFDNRWHGKGHESLGSGQRVPVPAGIANFDNNYVPEGNPPREWAERLYKNIAPLPPPCRAAGTSPPPKNRSSWRARSRRSLAAMRSSSSSLVRTDQRVLRRHQLLRSGTVTGSRANARKQ